MKMDFRKLSDVDKEYISAVYYSDRCHTERIEVLTKKYGVVGRTIRSWWERLNLTPLNSRLPSVLIRARERELNPNADFTFITAVQNKTSINHKMFENMQELLHFYEKKYNKVGQIVLIPTRYRNPTSPIEVENKKADMWWEPDLDEYYFYNKLVFGDVLIYADSRISPTATNPISGYEPHAEEHHVILGHSRMHLRTMPRFKNAPLRLICTTGYLTYKNYSLSKAGDKGYLHHSYGFTIIEKKKDGTCYPPRMVKVNDDGSFTDYKYYVSEGEVKEINKCSGFVWGDIHHRELNKRKYKASMKLMGEISPDAVVFHDLFDGSTVNPHEKDDLFIKKQKINNNLHYIDNEVDDALLFLEMVTYDYNGDIYVVQSNHDDFLDRHINKFDWKKDLHNSEAYLKYAAIQQSVNLMDYGNIFGYLIHDYFDGKVKYIKNNESLRINSYQCGYHGDHGVNGSRGNINSFKRINTKMIHGHGHSPTIMDGVTMVGVSCNIWQYYNSKGMSSWAFSDAIVHESGKNQLIVYDEDDFWFTNFN